MALTYRDIQNMNDEEREYNRRILSKAIMRLVLFFILKLTIILAINRIAKRLLENLEED